MLPYRNRLPASERLANAFFYKSPYFTGKILLTTAPVSRFGFVVSKRIDSRAVIRNRVKRVLRSCVEELLPRLTTTSDMLFVLQKESVTAPREKIYAELLHMVEKQNMIQSGL